MKKTVIIAILLAYVASILIVQFFGLKVVEMTGNTYISEIEISGFEFTNRADIEDPKYHMVKKLTNTSGKEGLYFGGYFIDGTYDKTPESLAANPNRVKILYDIYPYNASYKELTFAYDQTANENVVWFDEETQEFVFLKPRTVTVTLTSNDGSMVRKTVSISLTVKRSIGSFLSDSVDC